MKPSILGPYCAKDETVGDAIVASRRMKGKNSPGADEALRFEKLNALHIVQGEERAVLARAFTKIDRRHVVPRGISRVEYRRETREAIRSVWP